MRKCLLPAVLTGWFILLFQFLVAQQGNHWYFGQYAGLNFGSAPLTILSDGQTNTLEGTSSICDENGILLFYSDGVRVFNRNHEVMSNGAGLRGHVSSFQNSLIVPTPGNKNIYYLFTADAIENNGENGYTYSVIDMTMDNGLGNVVTKNIFLSGPATERITSIRGADYKSYWVITNEWNSNIFKTFKIDCNGLDPIPVVSTAGRILNQNAYSNIGVLRISGDGKMLVQTNAKGRPSMNPTDEFFQIFDFDNATGQVTNGRDIPLLNDGYYWGGEFSPNSNMLYLVNPFSKSIHQFDVGSNNPATILLSKQILPVTDGTLGAIAMGADLKLYIATGGKEYLHVINDPNNGGVACNLVLKQQALGRTSQLGLPNLNPNFYVNRAADFDFQSLGGCNGLMQFTSRVNVANVSLSWDFGDGQTSALVNPSHQFGNINSTYLVKLTVTDPSGCLNETIAKPVLPAGGNIKAGFASTILCDQLQATFLDSSHSTSSPLTYSWDFGDGNFSTDRNPVHVYPSSGVFNVKLLVTAGNGCMRDSITGAVNLIPPLINAGPDIQVISSSPIQLQATGGVRYHWEPALYLSDPDVPNPTMSARDDISYAVTGYDDKGCYATDSL
ncbi:MAG TPA: PKD domain-containing protein, partial [Chitinophagaceae bacterium]|nr:PKD domain-containing protein [Chitinophagaceae bacterium]